MVQIYLFNDYLYLIGPTSRDKKRKKSKTKQNKTKQKNETTIHEMLKRTYNKRDSLNVWHKIPLDVLICH